MLKILCQIVNYRWNLKVHFEFRHVYNVQIINEFKFQMLCHGIRFRAMYVESSVSAIPVSNAHEHINIMWIE